MASHFSESPGSIQVGNFKTRKLPTCWDGHTDRQKGEWPVCHPHQPGCLHRDCHGCQLGSWTMATIWTSFKNWGSCLPNYLGRFAMVGHPDSTSTMCSLQSAFDWSCNKWNNRDSTWNTTNGFRSSCCSSTSSVLQTSRHQEVDRCGFYFNGRPVSCKPSSRWFYWWTFDIGCWARCLDWKGCPYEPSCMAKLEIEEEGDWKQQMQKFRVYLKPKIRTSEFACYGANFMALVYADLNVEPIW